MKTIHEGVRYQCNLCEKSFTQPNNLRLHMRKAHDQGDRYQCDYCEKTFSQTATLKLHMERVHELDGKSVEHRAPNNSKPLLI